MNILIFSWRGPGHPNAGGAEIVTQEYAKAWVKAGHKVTIFTSEYTNSRPEEFIDGVKIIRKGSQILGVQIAAIKWYIFRNSNNFDLVIDHFHGIPFFTPLFVKSKKLAFIHEVAKEVWLLNHMSFPFNLFYGYAGKFIEPSIFKLFYKNIRFVTVSNSTKADLIKWSIPKKNITVIENGINPPKVKQLKRTKKQIITFFGSLSRDKGVETAIKVFSILEAEHPDLKFWIIGKAEDTYLNILKTLGERLKVLNKIKFWGFVNETKKYKLISQSTLIVNPSIREGWGLTVIEAASVGTPTIAFNVAGLKDSIKDKKTGIIVKEKTPEAMANEISNILKNNQKITKLSRNALIWSKKFKWEKSTIKSLKLINELIK